MQKTWVHQSKEVLTWAVLVSASIFVGVVGCNKVSSKVRPVTAQEAYGMLRNDFAVLVDVREEEEVRDSGVAAPAKWIPMSKISSDSADWKSFVQTLSKDKEVIFYCAGGLRAGEAASNLAAKGYKTANMGGFYEWSKAGLPVKSMGGAPAAATSQVNR
ncbi:rhodanese-like domain-containing protein [bacterium]|jgi:rhodanese-related sulfurtransferase|nr:rhodanese-like domain-containing protein [bacterium]